MTPTLAKPASKLDRPINWLTTSFLIVFHAGAIAALFFFSWKALAVAVLLHWCGICFGISMGYHRLLTHRSYKVPKWMEYFFAVCGTLTLEGGPIFWVATHRIHHQFSDREGDPHSPHDGAFWAHMGWLLTGESHHADTKTMSKYAPDLAKDPVHVWLNNYHWVPLIVSSLALLYFGGISYLLWGTFMRVTLGLHFTWLVNSATHMWGPRRFATRDDSRNNWWVALLTFGEGWHNNHHAHPTSARHGLAWFEFDMSWCQIWLLRKLGVAKNVKVARVNEPLIERKAA
ncbi:MAG TPA: acyl-CoA desaturase [Solibacterales bacterium]|nr:acyl-CoA desaturase [Bryobacterales bacterium]